MSSISNDFLVKHGLVVSTTATILSTANAYSTSTGALQVIGGAAIQQNLYVGGDINVQGTTSLSGLQIGPRLNFPLSQSPDQTATYYIGTETASIIFADGTLQSTRAPIAWTNQLFIDVANYYNIDPGIVFSPIVQGGYVAVGDTYFDDGIFGAPANHIYMMLDQGNGLVQFFDITPIQPG
jgi:hypothetical protein